MKDNYLKKIDIVRLFACVAILFYHLGILKGGYLAVCTFFVLTGYLSIRSISNKKKFSLKAYYLNKLKKIYLPLLIVVFITISVMTLFPSINNVNLKKEVTSILLGYNNYWQLNANLDYFVRHISSPFMHLWYIAILLQFEIVFPLVYIAWKKVSKKYDLNSILPILICMLFGALSYILFSLRIKSGNIMPAYYGTISRMFSIFFGIVLGIIHINNKPLIQKKHNRVFISYLLVLLALFIFIDFQSPFFSISMLLTSLITLRLISYSVPEKKKDTQYDKIIHSLSSVSYEIYLIQYPVIYILQEININIVLKIIITIVLTVILSYILHFVLDSSKMSKNNLLKNAICFILVIISIFGIYQYIIAKDHSKDAKKLENEIINNKEFNKKRQEEYAMKKKEEQEQIAQEAINEQEQLKEKVRNLKITGIGDSIMELCLKELYEEFPNGYFDAEVNRTEGAANGILEDLISKNMLGDVIVFNLGTNGNGLSTYRDQILQTIGNKKIFWLNATRPDEDIYNPNLVEYASHHDNMYIIDWVGAVENHPEYIVYDGVHPSVAGRSVYAETIFNAIYKVYEDEQVAEKEKQAKKKKKK